MITNRAYRGSWRRRKCGKSSSLSKSVKIRLNCSKSSRLSYHKKILMKNNSRNLTSKTTSSLQNLRSRKHLSVATQKAKLANGIWYLKAKMALVTCSMETPATEFKASNFWAQLQQGSISKRLFKHSKLLQKMSPNIKSILNSLPRNSQQRASKLW